LKPFLTKSRVLDITMPAFCTSGLTRSTLLAGYDPGMRQLPVGHVIYHGDAHAQYIQQQLRAAEAARRQASASGGVKNENVNDEERNSSAPALLCSWSNDMEAEKYAISISHVCPSMSLCRGYLIRTLT